MLKLKAKNQEIKKFSLREEQACWNEQAHIAFSYEMLTTDDDFTFKHFANIREQINAREALDVFLKEVSSNTWIDLQQRNKRQRGGFEIISSSIVKDSVCRSQLLPKESDIIVFRFGGDKYRLLGYKRAKCHILYILGYDFDFSAYNHG